MASLAEFSAHIKTNTDHSNSSKPPGKLDPSLNKRKLVASEYCSPDPPELVQVERNMSFQAIGKEVLMGD